MQEPMQQPKPRKTIHIGYVIAIIIIIIAAIVCAVVFWPKSSGPVTPPPTPTPTVSSTPTPTPISKVTVSIASTTASKSAKYFNVSVNISQISNFAGSSCDIKYDPKVIAVDNVSAGEISGTVINLKFWGLIPPGTQGTLRVDTLDTTLAGISGEGTLCNIRFKIIGAVNSSSAISFIQNFPADKESSLRLGDANDYEIPSTWVNGSVTIIK